MKFREKVEIKYRIYRETPLEKLSDDEIYVHDGERSHLTIQEFTAKVNNTKKIIKPS